MATASSSKHRKLAAQRGPVTVAVVTVSDSRTPKSDANAAFLSKAIAESGNVLHSIRIVPDEPDRVSAALDELCGAPEVQVILFNGGTGISRRDRTYDVLSRRYEKELTGFGSCSGC